MSVSRTTWITALIMVAAVIIAMLLSGSRAGEGTGATPAGRAPVRVMELRAESLPGEVRSGGFLRARADVTISAERPGRVAALPIAEGAGVEVGDIVALLDDTVAVANLERARTVAHETSLAPGVSAADLARAREQLRIAEHELALRRPTTPIDGVVEVHHVDPGEYVMPGTPLVDVVDARVLLLDVDVDPELIGRLLPGARVWVYVDAVDGAGAREGGISRVASRAESRTRRFRVEIAIASGPDGQLRAGMHAEAVFPLPGGEPAFYVPKAAVRTVRGERGLFVVESGGLAAWRPVTIAEVHHRPDLWRLKSGEFAEGDPVIVAGFSGLRDGSEVEVGAGR